jgi:hypothetical protein
MSELATVPKGELIEKFNRMRSMVKSARQETAEIAERAMGATATLAGGAASGVIRGLEEPLMVPGTDIPADVGIAAVAILAGVTGMAGKASDSIVQFGAGIGAAALAFQVKEAMQENRASK